ncbi:MAG: DUF4870 domain-containing protein [Acidimicrobiia bacterium]
MTTTTPIENTSAEISSDSRNWATLSHLSAFSVFMGIPSVVGPLVMWLLRRDDPYAEHHAKEALNFNISIILYSVVAAISIIMLIGILALPAVLIAWFVLTIQGAMRASQGEYYEYPLTIRFIK